MAFCPRCGKEVPQNARFCANCGFDMSRAGLSVPGGESSQVPPQPQMTYGFQVQGKDTTITVLLALLPGLIGLFGIGHIYVGQTQKGLIWLVIGIVLAVLAFIGSFFFICGIPFLIIGFVLWIYQTLEADKLARQYNDVLQRTGQPPW